MRVSCLSNNYVTTTSLLQSHFFSRYMAPAVVLNTLTSTAIAMNTTTNNNLSTYITNTSVANSVT